MKTSVAIVVLIFFAILSSRSANALVEIRGIAGLDLIQPKDLNKHLGQNSVKELYILPRLGFSAFFRPLPIDLGIGAEYLTQSIKVDAAGGGNSNEADLAATRLSLKAYYHILDGLFFTGPTGTIGLLHTSKLNIKTPAGTTNYDSGQSSSFGLGWETGFKIGFFMLGGEAGYQWYTVKSLSGPSGAATFEANLSCVYISGFFGAAF